MLVTLLVIWAVVVSGLIVHSLLYRIYCTRRERKSVDQRIEKLEEEAKAWRELSPESRALKRVNDSWVKEGFDRQQYTEIYNKVIREERRKPSEDSMPFHEELRTWKRHREFL